MGQAFGIHWFRRDLRVADNPALAANLEKHSGRVLGLFSIDRKFLARPDFGPARFAFFLATLRELQIELRKLGGELRVLDQGPDELFPKVVHALEKSVGKPSLWSFNRDYEPFARARDERITDLLGTLGIPVHTERDHLLLEPGELEKPSGGGYQVFTPFSKRWLEILRSSPHRTRVQNARCGDERETPSFGLTWKDVPGFSDCLADLQSEAARRARVPIPPAGHRTAVKRLDAFIYEALENYEIGRDLPAQSGTSGLSIFLKNGSLTSAQIFSRIARKFPHPQATSAAKFRSEIIWREFYYHLLWRTPSVEKRAFLEKYEAIRWPGRDEWFEAWCEGRTGYPIVDAGMRQLKATGWMHNRVRMIVASFLSKDLHIDWRRGEQHFMRELLDGDLAPNNGGWQWAASTGADPQPYFRIFNPALQAKRFDPEGEYIRRWVPEVDSDRYPSPIVEHPVQAKRAVQLYADARH